MSKREKLRLIDINKQIQKDVKSQHKKKTSLNRTQNEDTQTIAMFGNIISFHKEIIRLQNKRKIKFDQTLRHLKMRNNNDKISREQHRNDLAKMERVPQPHLPMYMHSCSECCFRCLFCLPNNKNAAKKETTTSKERHSHNETQSQRKRNHIKDYIKEKYKYSIELCR